MKDDEQAMILYKEAATKGHPDSIKKLNNLIISNEPSISATKHENRANEIHGKREEIQKEIEACDEKINQAQERKAKLKAILAKKQTRNS